MHEGCTEGSSNGGAGTGRIEAYRREILMDRLIARLIDCGMTREVAVFMMRQYRGRPKEFEKYVESVEESSREQMEEL